MVQEADSDISKEIAQAMDEMHEAWGLSGEFFVPETDLRRGSSISDSAWDFDLQDTQVAVTSAPAEEPLELDWALIDRGMEMIRSGAVESSAAQGPGPEEMPPSVQIGPSATSSDETEISARWSPYGQTAMQSAVEPHRVGTTFEGTMQSQPGIQHHPAQSSMFTPFHHFFFDPRHEAEMTRDAYADVVPNGTVRLPQMAELGGTMQTQPGIPHHTPQSSMSTSSTNHFFDPRHEAEMMVNTYANVVPDAIPRLPHMGEMGSSLAFQADTQVPYHMYGVAHRAMQTYEREAESQHPNPAADWEMEAMHQPDLGPGPATPVPQFGWRPSNTQSVPQPAVQSSSSSRATGMPAQLMAQSTVDTRRSNRTGQVVGYPQAKRHHLRHCNPWKEECAASCDFKSRFPERWTLHGRKLYRVQPGASGSWIETQPDGSKVTRQIVAGQVVSAVWLNCWGLQNGQIEKLRARR